MLILGVPVNRDTGISPYLASEATVGVGISLGIGWAMDLMETRRKTEVSTVFRYAIDFM